MKKTICFILLVLSCFLANADTLQNNNVGDTIQQQVEQHVEKTVRADNTDVVSSLMFAVDAINTIQTWSAVIMAFLTLIVALFGILGYRHIRKDMKENIEKNDKIISDKIQEINEKEQKFNDCITQVKVISEKLNGQEKYMSKTNQYLYEALDEVANQISDVKIANHILRKMLHNYQITNLYSTDSNKKYAALAYLQENGTLEDIEHLDYFSNCDLDEPNKIWAREIIGVLRHRNTL
jgi:uncharacterized protein YneF (UPF0154 family)